eukprot:gene22024-26533_t
MTFNGTANDTCLHLDTSGMPGITSLYLQTASGPTSLQWQFFDVANDTILPCCGLYPGLFGLNGTVEFHPSTQQPACHLVGHVTVLLPPPPPQLPVAPPLPPIAPSEWTAWSVTIHPSAAAATTKNFFFEDLADIQLSCTLVREEEAGVGSAMVMEESNCSSPLRVEWLLPGNHTFTVEGFNRTNGVQLEPKVTQWEVQPRFYPSPAAMDLVVTAPAKRTELIELVSTEEGRSVTAEDYSASLVTSGSVEPLQLTVGPAQYAAGFAELLIDTFDVGFLAAFEFFVVIEDTRTGTNYTSMLRVPVHLLVRPPSTLLRFPHGDLMARSPSVVDAVIAGDPEPISVGLWLVNIDNRSTSWNVTTNDAAGGWAWLNLQCGELRYTGQKAQLRMMFDAVPTVVPSPPVQSTTFAVFNSADSSWQEIRVWRSVVAAAISNRSTIALREEAEESGSWGYGEGSMNLTAGDSAAVIIRPLDRYGNALGRGDLFHLDLLQDLPRKEVSEVVRPSFDSHRGVCILETEPVAPCGDYLLYLRYVADGADRGALNWTAPSSEEGDLVAALADEFNLDGSPLRLAFRRVACDANLLLLAPSPEGDQCWCAPGAYNTMAYDRPGDPVCAWCTAGTYGHYNTAMYGVDGEQAVVAGATENASTTLAPTVSTSSGGGCAPCVAGSFQNMSNMTACILCPRGTFNVYVGSAEEAACEACGEDTVTYTS